MPTAIFISTETKNSIIQDYLYNKSMTCVEISKKYRLSYPCIQRYLKEWGVLLPAGGRERMFSPRQENEIIALYHLPTSSQKIAEKFNCNVETIRKLLIRKNIPRIYPNRKKITNKLLQCKSKIIYDYTVNKLSGWKIGEKYGFNGQLIYDYLKKWGLEVKNYKSVLLESRVLRHKNKIISLYMEEKWSLHEIAELFDTWPSEIRRHLQSWSIKTRKSPQYQFNNLEKSFGKILSDLNIKFQTQYQLENRLYDFYIPPHNLLIEVHGDYWHGNPKKYQRFDHIQIGAKKRDKIKKCLAKRYGFILLTFWEDDVKSHVSKVIKKLRKII